MESAQTSIHYVTAQCRGSFQRCLSTANLMHHEWAENRLADFNLWAAGVGASAEGRASLDSRLIFEPDVKTLVVNLLILLNGTVGECQELGMVQAADDIELKTLTPEVSLFREEWGRATGKQHTRHRSRKTVKPCV